MENLENQILNQGKDLEKKNREIEEAGGEEKEKKLKEAGELEEKLDKLEKDLGVSGEEIRKIYENLTPGEAKDELEKEGINPESDDLESAEKKIKTSGPGKLARLAACLVFLFIGSQVNQVEGSVAKSEQTPQKDKWENKSEEDFLAKLKVSKKFRDQEYLDIIVPSKPEGHEEEEWEIQFYDESGSTVGRAEVGDKIYKHGLGREGDITIEKAKLIIKTEEGKKEYDIDIRGEDRVKREKEEYKEKNKESYEEILKEIEKNKNYKGRFNSIFEQLDNENLTEEDRDKLNNYLKNFFSNYADVLAGEKNSEAAYYVVLNLEVDYNRVHNQDPEVWALLNKTEKNFARQVYEEEIGDLTGEGKINKIIESTEIHPKGIEDDPELAQTLERKLNEIESMENKENFQKELEELSFIFEGSNFSLGSQLRPLQKKYFELKDPFNG